MHAGNGAGFRGVDPADPYFERSTADVREGGGVAAAQPPGEGGPSLGQPEGSSSSTADAENAYLASLFTPCNR